MSDTAKKLAAYEDLYSLPDNVVGEIINGELVVSPRPSPKHSKVSSELGGELIPPFARGSGGPGGWLFLLEPELQLDNHIIVPDIAGWKKERLPHPPETNSIHVAPDWVCEVISPSTQRVDRVKKMPLYAEHGVSFIWLVDPIAKTLEVYKLDSEKWRLLATFGDTDKVRAEPFSEVEIALEDLWWD